MSFLIYTLLLQLGISIKSLINIALYSLEYSVKFRFNFALESLTAGNANIYIHKLI